MMVHFFFPRGLCASELYLRVLFESAAIRTQSQMYLEERCVTASQFLVIQCGILGAISGRRSEQLL